MSKIYIGGRITDNPNYIKEFETAEKLLISQGHAVINPVKNEDFTYKDYIDMGLNELMKCDILYLLKGWERSSGALLEFYYAKTVGLGIFCESEDKSC